MTVKPKEPKYYGFEAYTKVNESFKKCDYNYDSDGRFQQITSNLHSHKNVVDWNDKIFTCLDYFLTFNFRYMPFGLEQFCTFINFWLNGEVLKSEYEKYRDKFNIFRDFSHEYQWIKANNDSSCCKKYIYEMGVDEYYRMKLLYDFYDMYNGLKSSKPDERDKACKNLLSNTAIYNDAIDDYYVNHPDLYYKISHVKDLIEKVIKNSDTYCKQIKPFRIPPKFLEDEEKKKQEADNIRKKLEAEKQKRQAEEDERQRRQHEAEMRKLLMPTNHGVQRQRFIQGEPELSVEPGKSRESVNSEAQEHSKVLPYRLGSGNSERFEDLEQPVSGLYDDQLDKGVLKPGKEYTNTDGSFLGSSGFPGYITEVFRSVEPAPILGVSGGMGVLFLLFKVFKVLKL
ncbi:hypothetical protein PVNG_05944 [Plasmodium vivax North Korean]|uniref:VIR protein n=1 Tax=Plasmodium vivax North Korean TaxID=1035514 RepID=A0A0J9TK18_PLAVI|nr:hypothetical protein PVNG_05944 [Plasmodium vivax North Korean]